MIKSYISVLFCYLVFLPALILCYLPVYNQLRITKNKLLVSNGLILLFTISFFTYLTAVYSVNANMIFFLCLFLYFFYYNSVLKTSLSVSLAIYLMCTALITFPLDLALTLDAYIHPEETIYQYCIVGTLGQFLLCFLLLPTIGILLFFPVRSFVDEMKDSVIWRLITPIACVFILLNFLIEPRKYSTLQNKNVLRFFVFYIALSFLLYLFINFILYKMVLELKDYAKKDQQLQLQNITEHQYAVQQRYLDDTSKLRHDFRQSLFSLKEMASRKEYASLEKYLNDYCDAYPVNTYRQYSSSNAINALLNFYENRFRDIHIKMAWDIQLPPTPLSISDIDFCTLLGNLLENVAHASVSIPEEERCHRFSILIQHEKCLYIVSSNHFDGKVSKKDDTYFSTRRKGKGIGLTSIAQTATKYHGTAHFSNRETDFYMDIALSLSNPMDSLPSID